MNLSLDRPAALGPMTGPHPADGTPCTRLPRRCGAMAATYATAEQARAAQRELQQRWGLAATLLTAPLQRMPARRPWGRTVLGLLLLGAVAAVALAGAAGALAVVVAFVLTVVGGVWRAPRMAFDNLVARARRHGHMVLIVPDVPQAVHEDVASLLFSTGLAWWDGEGRRRA